MLCTTVNLGFGSGGALAVGKAILIDAHLLFDRSTKPPGIAGGGGPAIMYTIAVHMQELVGVLPTAVRRSLPVVFMPVLLGSSPSEYMDDKVGKVDRGGLV